MLPRYLLHMPEGVQHSDWLAPRACEGPFLCSAVMPAHGHGQASSLSAAPVADEPPRADPVHQLAAVPPAGAALAPRNGGAARRRLRRGPLAGPRRRPPDHHPGAAARPGGLQRGHLRPHDGARGRGAGLAARGPARPGLRRAPQPPPPPLSRGRDRRPALFHGPSRRAAGRPLHRRGLLPGRQRPAEISRRGRRRQPVRGCGGGLRAVRAAGFGGGAEPGLLALLPLVPSAPDEERDEAEVHAGHRAFRLAGLAGRTGFRRLRRYRPGAVARLPRRDAILRGVLVRALPRRHTHADADPERAGRPVHEPRGHPRCRVATRAGPPGDHRRRGPHRFRERDCALAAVVLDARAPADLVRPGAGRAGQPDGSRPILTTGPPSRGRHERAGLKKAVGAADGWEPAQAASASFMLRRIRPWRSTSSTFTRTMSPSESLSLTFSTRSLEIWEICTRPSLPGRIVTKAPKSISRATRPS